MHHTKEHNEKISKSCKGIPKKPETLIKMSEWQKGKPKPHMIGIKRTKNTLIKMSEWQKGKPKPQTTGDKNGNSKSIFFRGEYYGSIRQCSLTNNISSYKIKKELQNNI